MRRSRAALDGARKLAATPLDLHVAHPTFVVPPSGGFPRPLRSCQNRSTPTNSPITSHLLSIPANAENQDRAAIIPIPLGHLLIIADGAGGLSGGAQAATTAINFLSSQSPHLLDPQSCATALRRLDHHLASDKLAGETTCALAIITAQEIFGASVGDSGIWLITANTIDDLTAHQIRKPLLGSAAATPTSFTRSFTSNAHLLAATDGLLKYTSRENIAQTCRTHPTHLAPSKLVDLVRYPSANLPDDVTIILAAL